MDPKVAVPDDVSQRSGRGGGGGIPETKKTNKVFVGGVPHEMDEETISSYFKKFGEVSVGEPGVDWTPASMVHQAKRLPWMLTPCWPDLAGQSHQAFLPNCCV